MADREFEYDIAKRAKATNAATLRAVVAAYLLYLGGSLIWDMLKGKSTMSPVLAWIAGLGFIAAALAFGYYTWKHWHAEVEAARLTPAEADDDDTETP
jgi:hypothetical protein